jgi:GR25 family glycosyltransferase involved in LPS biosynthesis
MKPVFSSFDCAYVVNLDDDRERMQRISSRLRSLGVPFERVSALHPPDSQVRFEDPRLKAGAYACAASHLAVLRRVLERQHEYALILEDDAVFRDDAAELMATIAPQLASEQWDIFYMGLHLIRSSGRVARNLGRVEEGFHAHAYAVSKRAVPTLIAIIETMLAHPVATFDSYDDKQLVKLYSIPILAVQEANYSYTYGKFIDRLAQYFTVFNGDEFESHCVEMQQWNSDWRERLAVRRALSHAEELYLHGPLEEAANSYMMLTGALPRSERRRRLESALSSLARAIEEGSATDKQLIEMCASLSTTLNESW